MFKPERTVFARSFDATPLALWLLQRLSGLLLGPLVAVHVLWPAVGKSRPFLALLLIFIVGHGYSGVRRLRMRSGQARAITAAALVWSLIVLAAGLAIVIAAKPD
ncbi:MAG: hypothetical protein M3Z31_19375 [Pseudomonadota bacterium]|nr:hypothetical protein [Pseudomonadota bacterium]